MKTMSEKIEIAKSVTNSAAAIKDWRLRRKSDRALKTIAVELSTGLGYIEGSASELRAKYPGLVNFAPDEKVQIWAVGENVTGLQRLGFIAL